MKRHDLFVRRKTTVAQKLPEEHEEKVVNFHRYKIKERKEYKFLTSLIGNADQTPLTFDNVANTTVNVKGASSVPLITTGHEKDRFTAMLACLGDGTKLPLMSCLKDKRFPRKFNFQMGYTFAANKKDGLMSS